MAMPEWYDRTLALQLEMNPQTWTALQEHGVDETTQVRLEFFYAAPGEGEASELVAFLRDSTDYDAEATSHKKGMLSKKAWIVAGKTQPTAISLEILNEWVEWMVTAGAEKGRCEFDGWGAEVP